MDIDINETEASFLAGVISGIVEGQPDPAFWSTERGKSYLKWCIDDALRAIGKDPAKVDPAQIPFNGKVNLGA